MKIIKLFFYKLFRELARFFYEKEFQKALLPLASPYYLCIENTSSVDQKVALFSYNDNVDAVNYGSHAGIKITGYNGMDYRRILEDTNGGMIKFGAARMMTNNESQFFQCGLTKWTDADGRLCEEPFPFPIFIDPYQQKSNMVDIDLTDYGWDIDANAGFELGILPNTKIEMYLFPKYIKRGAWEQYFRLPERIKSPFNISIKKNGEIVGDQLSPEEVDIYTGEEVVN